MVRVHFSVHTAFYCQGLTLVSRCSQLSRGWLPAAGTPLLQVSALSGPPGRRRPGSGRIPPRLEALAIEVEANSGVGIPQKRDAPSMWPCRDQGRLRPHRTKLNQILGVSKGASPFCGFSSILATQNGPQRQRVSPRQGASLDLRMRERKTKKVEAVFLDRFHLFQAIPFEIDLLWCGQTAARR